MVEVNWLAIVVAAVANMVLGALWYAPSFFGKAWMKLTGLSVESLEQAKKAGMAKSYLFMFLSSLLMGYILALFLGGAATVFNGLQAGFWLWLGFVATTSLGSVLFEKQPFGLYAIHNGYHLASLLAMGAIIAGIK